MPANKRVIYWDSCVWLAWLKREQRPQEDWDGMEEVVQMVQAEKWVLLGSSVVHTEVLEASLPAEVAASFNRLQLRRSVQFVDADSRITRLSGDIRAFYRDLNLTDKLGVVEGMDAIHLATAIHYRADEFQTFDEGKKPTPRGRNLLLLNGNVAGHRLVVTKPRALQGRLSI